MQDKIELQIGRYKVELTFEDWLGEDDGRKITPELISDLKEAMASGTVGGDFLAEEYGWHADITWEARFDYNSITSEEEDVILGEIIDEDPKGMLQIAGVYEIVREHFNNEILSRAEEKEMFKLHKKEGAYGN